MNTLTSLLEYVIKTLVDKPDLVSITHTVEENTIKLAIHVGSDDLGRVIGKDGQTIRAIRSLLSSVAPAGQEVMVDIIK